MKKFLSVLIITTLILGIGCFQLPQIIAEAKETNTKAVEAFNNIEMMEKYVNFLKGWVETIEKPQNSVGIAINSLKEIYTKKGELDKAEQALLKALESVNNRGARTLIRFNLGEIYQETNKPEKAAEQFLKIIEENGK